VDGTPIDLEKMRSLAVIGSRSRSLIADGRRADGVRTKTTTDELGNKVIEHAKGDRQDVLIKAPTMQVTTATREVRD
jgi:hypothetical protein